MDNGCLVTMTVNHFRLKRESKIKNYFLLYGIEEILAAF